VAGDTPVITAVKSDGDVLELLLGWQTGEGKRALSVADAKGLTPLHWAAR
jgi:hypothetical protein